VSTSTDNRRVTRRALWVCLIAFSFAFALVPLYEVACEKVFGIRLDGTPIDAAAAAIVEVDHSREVVVEFDASVNSRLPWSFRAAVPNMRVHPGQLTEAVFYARNDSAAPIIGQAIPSVAPSSASIYFNKTECFCFTEQYLGPGEEREMPVRFVVDPGLPDRVKTLTLSYTFYNNDIATARLAAAGSH